MTESITTAGNTDITSHITTQALDTSTAAYSTTQTSDSSTADDSSTQTSLTAPDEAITTSTSLGNTIDITTTSAFTTLTSTEFPSTESIENTTARVTQSISLPDQTLVTDNATVSSQTSTSEVSIFFSLCTAMHGCSDFSYDISNLVCFLLLFSS